MDTDRGRWIWLDDLRHEPVGWERVKTAAECIASLARGGVDAVSLDHDLADEQQTVEWEADRRADEATGYTVALWIEAQAAADRWHLVPSSLVCHSANLSGRKRIEACFASIERMRVEWTERA